MSKRAELANEFHNRGYSCAHAVACAFSDVIGYTVVDPIHGRK